MSNTPDALSYIGKRMFNRKWRAMYLYGEQNRLRQAIHEQNVKISQNDFYPDYDGYVADMQIELKNLILVYQKNKEEIAKLESEQRADKLKFKELNRKYQENINEKHRD